jgi:hypothetical protein
MTGHSDRLLLGLQTPERVLLLIPIVLAAVAVFSAVFFALVPVVEGH